MVMTRTQIVTLANSLAHSLGDAATTLPDSFDSILDRLGKTSCPFISTATWSPTAATFIYSYPSTAVKLLAVIAPIEGASSNTIDLPLIEYKENEAYDKVWASQSGVSARATPRVYKHTRKDARTFSTYPIASETQTDEGLLIFSENRTTDIPVWLALPIVCEMLAEEFAYPSDHQDLEASKLWQQLADILKAFVGI